MNQFEYQLFDTKMNIIDNLDWLKINYISPDRPDTTNKMLVESVIYSINDDGTTGSVLTSEEITELEENTRLRVAVEASDFRNVEMKGLIGIDMDIALSKNLELIEDTTLLTEELPLFNSILQKENGLRIKAGSAPDGFGIGGISGDNERDKIVSFDVILQNQIIQFQ